MAQKILVVDDSRTIRASLKASATAQGFTVVEAENGYIALKAVKDEKPDIIFADVMMPRLDGYKFCSVIKGNPTYARIPIVMLTSKDGMLDQARARVAHADGYIVKPFAKPTLYEVLAKHLNWRPPA